MTYKVLIAGCGYVGTALGMRLTQRGDEVWGLRRDPSDLPPTFHRFAADLAEPGPLSRLPRDFDFVVYAASAGESSDVAYRRAYVTGLTYLLVALSGSKVRRIFFTSSTAVYAQSNGEWVDERSETNPTHFAGLRTLEAEAALRQGPIPATVLRCAGIYGPGRTRLIDSVRDGTARATDRFTNRIHRDDIAGSIVFLMDSGQTEDLLVLSDNEPAPQQEVTRFLAARLGVPEPPHASVEPGARGGHKRCRNERLAATGYRLLFPTYREGYGAMLSGGPHSG
jgi:nucleoside-diphosphate-sugar epimerase